MAHPFVGSFELAAFSQAFDNTEPKSVTVTTNLQNTTAGPVRHIRFNGLTGVIVAHRKVLESPPFGQAARNLEARYNLGFESIAAANAEGAQGNYLAHEIKREIAPITAIYREYVRQVRSARENLAVRTARVMAVPEGNQSLRATLANWFLSHSPAERIKLAMNCEFELAASIMQIGKVVSGLESRIWEEFSEHWMRIKHIQMTGLQADFALQPTADFVTAAGPDPKAAYKAAESVVADFKKESEVLDLAEQFAKSVLETLMLLTEKPAADFL